MDNHSDSRVEKSFGALAKPKEPDKFLRSRKMGKVTCITWQSDKLLRSRKMGKVTCITLPTLQRSISKKTCLELTSVINSDHLEDADIDPRSTRLLCWAGGHSGFSHCVWFVAEL